MASATEEFYSVIGGAFALMLILLTAVNEEIEAGLWVHLKMTEWQKYSACQNISRQYALSH
jgi:hypothetical protein